jgi:hypothetical protein
MKAFIVSLLFFYASGIYSQSRKINQLDSAGKKDGLWIVYLDETWRELKDSSGAKFFRYTYFDHGENVYPMGPWGSKSWKLESPAGNSQAGNKIKMLDGEYKWIDEKGKIRSVHKYDDGQRVSIHNYFSSGELDQIFDDTKKWQGQPLTYRISEFDKKGNVRGRYFMRKEKSWQFFNGGADSTKTDTLKMTGDSAFTVVKYFVNGKLLRQSEQIFVPVNKGKKVSLAETIRGGNSRYWYFKGELFKSIFHGTSTKWYENGQKQVEEKYYYDKATGKGRFWDKSGKEITEKAMK